MCDEHLFHDVSRREFVDTFRSIWLVLLNVFGLAARCLQLNQPKLIDCVIKRLVIFSKTEQNQFVISVCTFLVCIKGRYRYNGDTMVFCEPDSKLRLWHIRYIAVVSKQKECSWANVRHQASGAQALSKSIAFGLIEFRQGEVGRRIFCVFG